jgi:hypothetical protein
MESRAYPADAYDEYDSFGEPAIALPKCKDPAAAAKRIAPLPVNPDGGQKFRLTRNLWLDFSAKAADADPLTPLRCNLNTATDCAQRADLRLAAGQVKDMRIPRKPGALPGERFDSAAATIILSRTFRPAGLTIARETVTQAIVAALARPWLQVAALRQVEPQTTKRSAGDVAARLKVGVASGGKKVTHRKGRRSPSPS